MGLDFAIDELYATGHQHEARLLCCTYIEELGNGLERAATRGAASFSKVVEAHGGEPVLALIHPKALKESLPYKSVSPADRAALEPAVTALPPDETLTKAELVTLLGSKVSGTALGFVDREK